MAERELKASGKSVQKMTKDGLVEINLAEKTSRRISERGEDIRLTRNRSPDASQEKSSVSGADFEENPFKMCALPRARRLVGGNPTQQGVSHTTDSESWVCDGNIVD